MEIKNIYRMDSGGNLSTMDANDCARETDYQVGVFVDLANGELVKRNGVTYCLKADDLQMTLEADRWIYSD